MAFRRQHLDHSQILVGTRTPTNILDGRTKGTDINYIYGSEWQ